jgi:hypothetical protein
MGWTGCFLPIEARGRRSRSTCRFRSSWRFGGAVARVLVAFGPLRCDKLAGSHLCPRLWVDLPHARHLG